MRTKKYLYYHQHPNLNNLGVYYGGIWVDGIKKIIVLI